MPMGEERSIGERITMTSIMDGSRIKYVIVLALMLATLGVFGNSLTYDFVNYDDPAYITGNDQVKQGFTADGIVWAFTTTKMGNWNPLTWLSHMADVQLYGLDSAGHRLTNVLLHTASTLLLFLLFQRMTGSLWRSAAAAALFAIHPLRVESVVWISERKDVLSTFLFLLALLAYVRYVARPGTARYLLVVLLFVLGLLAKPMLVTLPVVLLLLDYWPLHRFRSAPLGGARPLQGEGSSFLKLMIEKAPFLLLSAIISAVTIWAQRHEQAMMSVADFPFLSRLSNAVLSYAKYLGMMFWPTDLAVLYPLPAQAQSVPAVLALLFLCGVTTAAVLESRRRPYLLMGWLWYLVTLAPVIGIIQVGLQSMADRYTYIPSIGIALMAVWGVADAVQVRSRRMILILLSCVVLAFFMVTTVRQAAYWENSVSLFSHAVQVTQNNRIAHVNLGDALDRYGRYEEAMAHYRIALRIKPDDAFANYKLANDLDLSGRISEALPYYRRSLQIDERNPHVHNNFGIALMRMGSMTEAKDHFIRAIQLDPGLADAHYNLGLALVSAGRLEDAIREFAEALRLNPADVEARREMESAQMRLHGTRGGR
jgi:tetratricopeptide (TPR) repeat protein